MGAGWGGKWCGGHLLEALREGRDVGRIAGVEEAAVGPHLRAQAALHEDQRVGARSDLRRDADLVDWLWLPGLEQK